MTYRKTPRVVVPLNIWEFARSKETTDDDLMKVTFNNDDVLFFAWKDEPNATSSYEWRLDEQLMPSNLAAILQDNNLTKSGFIISRSSGYVGKTLHLNVIPAARWDVTMWFLTDATIKSIRPARRPRKPDTSAVAGKIHSIRSSDHH